MRKITRNLTTVAAAALLAIPAGVAFASGFDTVEAGSYDFEIPGVGSLTLMVTDTGDLAVSALPTGFDIDPASVESEDDEYEFVLASADGTQAVEVEFEVDDSGNIVFSWENESADDLDDDADDLDDDADDDSDDVDDAADDLDDDADDDSDDADDDADDLDDDADDLDDDADDDSADDSDDDAADDESDDDSADSDD